MNSKSNKRELKRKNIHMSLELAEWYENLSKEMGVSQSGLMVMALSYYKNQQESIKIGQHLPELFKQLQMIHDEKENSAELTGLPPTSF